MILPGSYANGFAPRDGEPLYPELWHGCVGAWNPGLGPTGLTLRDWSGFGNHGVLTDMDPGTDWVASQGRYALEFDGTNDWIGTPGLGVNSGTRSISCWFRTSQSLSNNTYMSIIGWGQPSTGSAFYAVIGTDTTIGTNAFGVTQFGNSVGFSGVNNNEWRHGVIVNLGQSWSVYVDGIFRIAKDMTTSPASGSTVRIANWPFSTGIGSNANFIGQLSDLAIYNRALSPNEIRLLATRRGTAYELAPRRRASAAVQFNRRRRLLLGAGS